MKRLSLRRTQTYTVVSRSAFTSSCVDGCKMRIWSCPYLTNPKRLVRYGQDHLVECAVQKESKRRGGRFHPELNSSSRREKIDRRAVLGVNWYDSVQNSHLSNHIVDVWIIFTHQWAPRRLIATCSFIALVTW